MNYPENLECLSGLGADPVRRRRVKTWAAVFGVVLLAVPLLIDRAVTGVTAKPVAAKQGVTVR